MGKKAVAKQEKRVPLGKLATEAHQRGDFAEAENYYRILLKEHPDNAALLASLGQVCLDQGKYEEAISLIEHSLSLDPGQAKATYNLGLCHQHLGNREDAEKFYLKTLDIEPNTVSAHNNLSGIYYTMLKYDKALKHVQKAIELDPDSALSTSNLSLIMLETGHVADSVQILRKALIQDPQLNMANSNLCMNLHYQDNIEPDEIFREHLAWAERHEKPRLARQRPHSNELTPGRRLRIGYLSPDFRVHSVAFYMVPILTAHNKENVEIFCYSDNIRDDDLTDHLRGLGHHWRDTRRLKDDALAQLIRDDQIDILVDLAGHTGDNRLTLFALKPAPVQVTYLGYPDTTGLASMDYRLTDDYADPTGRTEQWHSETLMRLPNSFLCYQPPSNVPDVAPLPALKNGYITFGSFNTLSKVNNITLQLWCDVLKAVPGSHLLLKAKGLADEATQLRIRQALLALGIEDSRIELLAPESNALEHMGRYAQMDIALDTFPYHGTTTSCEAMWMGVPVLTLAGESHVSRVGVSLLSSTGHEDWIAHSRDELIAKAQSLAGDVTALTTLRQGLREQLRTTPLIDAHGFTANLEIAYRKMWLDHLHRQGIATEVTAPAWQQQQSRSLEVTIGKQHLMLPNLPSDPHVAQLIEPRDPCHGEEDMISRILPEDAIFIDATPGYGLASLFLAKPARQKYYYLKSESFEPWLGENLERTGIDHRQLDCDIEHLFDTLITQDLERVDAIRFDSFAVLSRLLQQDSSELARLQPLILIGPHAKDKRRHEDLQYLEDMGFRVFRHSPALGLLTMIELGEAAATVEGLLFAVPPAQMQRLAAAQLLLPLDKRYAQAEQVSLDHWRQYFDQLPFNKILLDDWQALAERQPYATEYHEALGFYTESRRIDQTAEARYTYLTAAFTIMTRLIELHPTLPRLLTTARIAYDLGLQESANQTLEVLLAMFSQGQQMELNEPFLPVYPRYDTIVPHDAIAAWCLAAIIEAHEMVNRGGDVDQEQLERCRFFGDLGYPGSSMEQHTRVVAWRLGGDTSNSSAQAQGEAQIQVQTQKQSRAAAVIAHKPDIAILYHLARTGGTLISKCLGVIEGNVLLSEVHPALSVMDPLAQAAQWFHLLSMEERQQFLERGPFDYLEAIKLISSRTREKQQKLILRDWSHIDFTAVPFVAQPSYQLTQTALLAKDFNVHQLATVRHPIDSFLSVANLAIMQGKLKLEDYLAGCHQFALRARDIGFVRYEDFCAAPQAVLKDICETLQVNYADDFLNNYYKYQFITGEVSGGRSSKEIKVPKRRPVAEELLEACKANEHYWATLEILGYEHYE